MVEWKLISNITINIGRWPFPRSSYFDGSAGIFYQERFLGVSSRDWHIAEFSEMNPGYNEIKYPFDITDEPKELVTVLKRPRVSLMSSYRQSWKARNHHFVRYSDVKLKDERRPTVSDLANQKHVMQKVHGWKIYHLSAQIDEMVRNWKLFFSDYVPINIPFDHCRLILNRKSTTAWVPF